MQRRILGGFTLIELLTVIAIIALLASIILASLSTARQRSRDSKRVSDLQSIQLALQLYYNDNNAYPATLGSLVPTYISSLPTDPSYSVTSGTCASAPTTAGCYWYSGLGSGSSCLAYHLGTTLEQSTNSALNNDVDDVPQGATPPGPPNGATGTGGSADAAICTGSDADFYGNDDAACSTNHTGTGACYDLHS